MLEELPYAYVAGFIKNCGIDPERVLEYRVEQHVITWKMHGKPPYYVHQRIVYEPPPVTGGEEIMLTFHEGVGMQDLSQ